MSIANKALIHRWFEEVWNQKREAAIYEMMHPECLIFGLQGAAKPLRGPDEFIPFWRAFTSAIPNLTVAVESTIAEADVVVARCSARGKHTGAGLQVPPTGRTFSFTGMCLARVADGLLHEGWNSFDFLSFYQQLGVLPDKI